MDTNTGIKLEEYKLFLQHMNQVCDHLENVHTVMEQVTVSGSRSVTKQLRLSLKDMTDLTNDCAGKIPRTLVDQDVDNAEHIQKTLGKTGQLTLPGLVGGLLGVDLGRTLVGLETFQRVGSGKNSFGTALEIMVRNQHNINPFTKGVAVLGENLTETGADVIINGAFNEVKAGGAGYAQKIVVRVGQGDYAHCEKIITSKEMYEPLKKGVDSLDDSVKINVQNSHISQEVAKKATLKTALFGEKGLTGAERAARAAEAAKNIKIGTYVKAGVIGGVIGGGIEALVGYQDLKDGTITGGEYTNNIARETVAGVASAVVSTAIVTAVAAAGAGAIAATAAGVAIGVAVSVGVSWMWNDLAETVAPNVVEGAKQVAESVSTAYEAGKVDMKAIGETCVKDVGNAVKSGVNSIKTGIEKMKNPTSVGDFIGGAAKVAVAPVETALNVAVAQTKAVVNTVASAGAAVVNWVKKW